MSARPIVRWDRTAFPLLHHALARATRAQTCSCARITGAGITGPIQGPDGPCPLHPEVKAVVSWEPKQ